MAMNKKEQAEFANLKRELAIAKAFRFTAPVSPDVQPESGRLKTGFLFNAYDKGSVAVACSSSISHAYGRDDKTTTQQPRHLYSTKVRALRALRHTLELRYAANLADIDEQIANEYLFDVEGE